MGKGEGQSQSPKQKQGDWFLIPSLLFTRYETLNASHLPFEQFPYALNKEVETDVLKGPSQH